MKAVNSSTYSSPSLLRIMIPQFHQLLPLEANISGNWSNSTESLSTGNKPLSPPASICTDTDYQATDISLARKYSLSTPPLSNMKSESIDSTDCLSPHVKQDSAIMFKNHEKHLEIPTKISKKCSNFSIERLLSTPTHSSPTNYFFKSFRKVEKSIFTKKKMSPYSDSFLHRIVSHRKQSKNGRKSLSSFRYRRSTGRMFIPYVLDLVKDLIHQENQIENSVKFSSVDALEQLAEIACKLDPRRKQSIVDEDQLTSKTYQFLLKQCHLSIKQIYQKYHQRKRLKRLYFVSKSRFKRHLIHFPRSILNLLLKQKKIIIKQSDDHADCFIMTPSDNENITNEKNKTSKSECCHLLPNQIVTDFEILLPNNGLVYEGTIQPIDNHEDLLLIRLNRERQTYLIPIQDLCRLSCPKIIPTDFHLLSKGSRVCAYWSTSLRGLHPATVKKIPSDINESSMVNLLFDDGDTGFIKLDEIRLLPDDFQIQGIHLEEWRVSSSQIPLNLPVSRRTSRRVSSTSSSIISRTSSIRKSKKEKAPSIVPQWKLNTRNSTITRQDTKEVLRVGDCVVLHGADKSLSYIGKVLKFYRNRLNEQDLVRLKWYYSPQETFTGRRNNDLPGALYESTHTDENLIATIRYKGTIYQSYDDYVQRTDYGKKREETDFYLVGRYDPTTGELQRYDEN